LFTTGFLTSKKKIVFESPGTFRFRGFFVPLHFYKEIACSSQKATPLAPLLSAQSGRGFGGKYFFKNLKKSSEIILWDDDKTRSVLV